jgi:hypothetical protein
MCLDGKTGIGRLGGERKIGMMDRSVVKIDRDLGNQRISMSTHKALSSYCVNL